jgi:glutamyl-tRNA reductase
VTGNSPGITAVCLSRSDNADGEDGPPSVDESAVGERLVDRDGVQEAFVLATCHRVEGYVVAVEREIAERVHSSLAGHWPEAAVDTYRGESALRHLFRVSAGLESPVCGEDQILGQCRRARKRCREAELTGSVLNAALERAIRAGKRARSETAINDGVVSLGSAARQLVQQRHDITEPTGVVVGAGEMGQLAAAAFDDMLVDITVVNRTLARADDLATTLDSPATSCPLSGLADAVDGADVVLCATGSETHVLDGTVLRSQDERVVVDMAQPPDVAPTVAERPATTVYDLQRLEAYRRRTRQQRKQAVGAVEDIIDTELDGFYREFKRQRAERVIATMYQQADEVKRAEVEQALNRLDLDEESEAVVESLAESLVSQLLAPPTATLRDAAEDGDHGTLRTALALFSDEHSNESGRPDEVTEPDAVPVSVREE